MSFFNRKKREAMLRARKRAIDVEILWPACLDLIGDIYYARRAFLIHALSEPAWTDDLSDRQIVEMVNALKENQAREQPIPDTQRIARAGSNDGAAN